MGCRRFADAVEKLQNEFSRLDFACREIQSGGQAEKLYQWPGPADEDFLICVHRSGSVQEPFHRHDFFYFNYTYRGEYESLSCKYDHRITIREGELYAGQPYAGHALCVHDNHETVIIGVLVRRETFFRSFLPTLSAGSGLFHFFTGPAARHFSEEFIHFKPDESCAIRSLLEIMAVEYAFRRPDTQDVLKPLVLAFFAQIARQYAGVHPDPAHPTISGQVVQYILDHVASATLKGAASQLSYHPNYISTVMRKELGKTFSEVLLEQRMTLADALLKDTSLTVEEIARMLGYNSSNFHRAFRGYYRRSPRQSTEKL